jgi:DMSO/TMAO reductase YedYZ molybdopterin-dependent catalytic subunit
MLLAAKIESMPDNAARRVATVSRRAFLRAVGVSAGGAAFWEPSKIVAAEEFVAMPFENGRRPLVKYPQKRPLIRLTTRPPQLETPFAVFNEGALTPNDAFFVRYHLMFDPFSVDAENFRLRVSGAVQTPLEFTVAELKTKFEPVEIVAVNQCSGNGRGFSQPRVPGGQMGNGAMGNARWKGARLKDVLKKCSLGVNAYQVSFNGLDAPLLEKTPDFVKALELEHVLGGEVLLAYEMNGEPLPALNGFPLRLVVPGYYGTYWMKHVHEIKVLEGPFTGYWMSAAYRIPDNPCACVPAGAAPAKTIPIHRLNVRSFITSLADGAEIRSGQTTVVKGIAFDGGEGIREVLFSEDGGKTWREAELGEDLGKYSFRPWQIAFTPKRAGAFELKVKATNRIGQSQPLEPLWNPAGYMRNVVETVRINVV